MRLVLAALLLSGFPLTCASAWPDQALVVAGERYAPVFDRTHPNREGSDVRASPDCSHTGQKPSAECVVKLDDCKKTSIVYVLAVLGRHSGMTEGDNLSRIAEVSSKEVWYAKNSAFIKNTVHAIYTDEKTYRALRAGIAPNMALGLSKLIAGCSADPSVKVGPQ